MWMHSMVNTGEKAVAKMFGKGFSIIGTADDALLIDYRLLCCLLFAEHSLQVKVRISLYYHFCGDEPQVRISLDLVYFYSGRRKMRKIGAKLSVLFGWYRLMTIFSDFYAKSLEFVKD